MYKKFNFNKDYNLKKIPEGFIIKYNNKTMYSISNEFGAIKIFSLSTNNLYWAYISSLNLSTLCINKRYELENLNYMYYLYIFTSVFKNDQ